MAVGAAQEWDAWQQVWEEGVASDGRVEVAARRRAAAAKAAQPKATRHAWELQRGMTQGQASRLRFQPYGKASVHHQEVERAFGRLLDQQLA